MQIAVTGNDVAGLTLALRLRIKGHEVTVHERTDTHALDEHFTVIAPMRDLFLKSGGALDDLLGIVPVETPLLFDGVALPASGTQVPAVRAAWGDAAGRAWGLLLQQAADVWQAVRTATHTPRRSLHQVARRTFSDARPRALLLATVPDVAHLSDAALVYPYLRQAFGCWQFDGGMVAFESVLRERCLKLGIQMSTQPAPTSALSVDTHYQRMFIRPPHWLHRGPTNLTQRLGLPFVGMAAEAIAQRLGRA